MSILLVAAAGLRTVRKDFDRARAQATEAISICEELDDPRGLAWSLEVFAGLAAPAETARPPRGCGGPPMRCSTG